MGALRERTKNCPVTSLNSVLKYLILVYKRTKTDDLVLRTEDYHVNNIFLRVQCAKCYVSKGNSETLSTETVNFLAKVMNIRPVARRGCILDSDWF